MRTPDAASLGWATILAGALGYDLWLVRTGRRSLSAAFARRRWVAGGAWAMLTAHLLDLLPRPLDPFHRAAGWFERPRRFTHSRP